MLMFLSGSHPGLQSTAVADARYHVDIYINSSPPREASTPATQEASPPVSEPTCQMLFDEIDALRRERDAAIDERDQARARLNSTRLSSCTVADHDEKILHWTHLGSFRDHFLNIASSVTIPTVPPIDQVFLHARHIIKYGLKFEHLSYQIGNTESTHIDHFWKWLNSTYIKLQFLIKWPNRDFIFGNIPPATKKLFPRLTGIIDCFETFVEAPSNLKARAQDGMVQLQKAHHHEVSHIMQSSWSDQFPLKSQFHRACQQE